MLLHGDEVEPRWPARVEAVRQAFAVEAAENEGSGREMIDALMLALASQGGS